MLTQTSERIKVIQETTTFSISAFPLPARCRKSAFVVKSSEFRHDYTLFTLSVSIARTVHSCDRYCCCTGDDGDASNGAVGNEATTNGNQHKNSFHYYLLFYYSLSTFMGTKINDHRVKIQDMTLRIND